MATALRVHCGADLGGLLAGELRLQRNGAAILPSRLEAGVEHPLRLPGDLAPERVGPAA